MTTLTATCTTSQYNLLSLSNMRRLLFLATLFMTFMSSCVGKNEEKLTDDMAKYVAYGIRPLDPEGYSDAQWAEYLYNHFKTRANNPNLVHYEEVPDTEGPVMIVDVSMNSELEGDYAITVEGDNITLVGRRKANVLWLAYQFISYVGMNDTRFEVRDLHPCMIDMKTKQGYFAFDYRGIYTLANENPDMIATIGSQNVDSDWGLWGHNLFKVFRVSIPEQAQALVNGKRTTEQLCLTSDRLYDQVEQFRVYNYGDTEDDLARFCIMPLDNQLVCQCDYCQAAGNTPKNCTPALADLIRRLAERFPCHQFFTVCYGTHTEAPADPLPDNAGVFISAIDFEMSSHPKGEKDFVARMNAWKEAAKLIYVWDYANNFDDYLTPYPNLMIMADRIRWYRNLGVKGIFINGGSPTYTTFNEMQTCVLATLLIDPDLDVKSLIHRYIMQYFGEAAESVYRCYIALEEAAYASPKPLDFYGGITNAVRIENAPDAKRKAQFLNLIAKAKLCKDSARIHMDRLLTALAYPVLERARLTEAMYSPDSVADYIRMLQSHTRFPEMTEYREVDGSIDEYLNQWEQLRQVARRYQHNPLRGVKLKAKTELDEDYQNIGMLNDGLCGFPTNYHDNWMIVSAPTLEVEFPANSLSATLLTASTFHNPRWRLAQPKSIELIQNGNVLATAVPTQDEPKKRTFTTINISPVNTAQPFTLRFRGTEGLKMAIDEIISE